MAGRLGIDFGTSNTALAVWDSALQQVALLEMPEFGRSGCMGRGTLSGPMDGSGLSGPIWLVPSVIHYAADGRRWLGDQVTAMGLESSDRTFSLIKRYILNRSPASRWLDGRQISNREAGRDFLGALLSCAVDKLGIGEEDVALTVPVEAFEPYTDWLLGVAASFGCARHRLIDEASAAALGYGATVEAGQVYLVIDFGGGTLDVAMVLMEPDPTAAIGWRARVLGKAGRELGGSTIDAWLLSEALKHLQIPFAAEEMTADQRSGLLLACRAAKETLSDAEMADVHCLDPLGRPLIRWSINRGEFEALLDRNDALAQVDRTIRRAMRAAHDRGYDEDKITSVLMVGGSSLIPAVQKTVQRIFGKEKVQVDHPLDAVARGAARFVAGVDLVDHVQHDYAIRWMNPATSDYDYHVLVRRGTRYPAPEPVARLTVKASYAGQVELGIAIYELSERLGSEPERSMELVFDPSGGARVVPVSIDEQERRRMTWLNEQSPTFLSATPPAQEGESRFAVEFSVDAHKRLLITARDLRTGEVTHQSHPVVKLR